MGVLNGCCWSYISVHVAQRQGYTLNWSTRSSFSRSGTSLVPSSRVLRNSTWNSTISGKFPNSTSSWRSKKKNDKCDRHDFFAFNRILQYFSYCSSSNTCPLLLLEHRSAHDVIQTNQCHYCKCIKSISLLCKPPPLSLIINSSCPRKQLLFSWLRNPLFFETFQHCWHLKANYSSKAHREHLTYLILREEGLFLQWG